MTHGAPHPSILLVWDPMEVARWQQLDRLDGWWMAGSVSTTRARERAVVYRTQSDQGLAGVFDFASDAFKHPDLGWAAFGRPLPLKREVPRSALLSDDVLAPIFLRPQGRRRLAPEAAAAVASLMASAPRWQSVDDVLPDLRAEDWTWLPARQDGGWGVEGAMRDAICGHPASWEKLGYKRSPQREVSPPGSRLRMDLFERGVVGECKLVAGLSTLRQLDGYLELQRKSDGRKKWVGHVIVAFGYSDRLATEVFDRPDVRLWVCRRESGRPKLTEITRRRPMP